MRYPDRDALRMAVDLAGGIEQALYRGLLRPDDMPDDEMLFQAKDLELCQQEIWPRITRDETPLQASIKMFRHAMNRAPCEGCNQGARWMMGLSASV